MRHFLQSPAWATFEKALGKAVFLEKQPSFSYLAVLERTKLGSYLYLPYGPVISNKTPKKSLKSALASLSTLAKTHHCFFVRIEPTYPFPTPFLAKLGLIKSKDLNPADTWCLNLTQPTKTILTNMSQGTRTRHNQFSKKGLSIELTKNPEDIKYLIALQQKLAKQKGINTFSPSYLKTELAQPFASLYLVRYTPTPATDAQESVLRPTLNAETAGKIVSASLFFDDKKSGTRFYMQSATDSAYKKLPATVGLLSTALFDAKEKGLTTFDFWGIAPEDAPSNHPWAGFTTFKKSFGGYPVHYSGTYDFPLDQKKYSLYTSVRSLNLKLRKLKAKA